MFEASVVTYDSFQSYSSQQTDKDRQRSVGLMKGAMLFLALAVENALKGAYVHIEKPEVKNGKVNSKHFHKHSHDLKDVAMKLDLNLTDDLKLYLDRLSMFIQWASRYKAPLREIDYIQSRGQIRLKHPSDFENAKNLINVLQQQSGYVEGRGWPFES
ncbi:hypothetical protein B6N13_04460 [Marinomonas sp. UCMA 3892]|uniref:hypothetical protein n=1 Tax=unclassified Marinomonas TaxID=196814 RepID=UPI00146B34F1|nr:hypothetical protein [Marinomonas sp. UCMA 3892]NLU97351.1 hypothetical protein [Marinomonas sp. UCMA 3892]